MYIYIYIYIYIKEKKFEFTTNDEEDVEYNKTKRIRTWNVIWFVPPCSVKTNIGAKFFVGFPPEFQVTVNVWK